MDSLFIGGEDWRALLEEFGEFVEGGGAGGDLLFFGGDVLLVAAQGRGD